MLAVNEGRGRAFAESVELAGTVMYPQHEWRQLPRDHWAYTLQLPVTSDAPRLMALSNGVRELIVLSQTDLSATFQDRSREAAGHDHAAANLYFYASELGRVRPRLARATAPAAPAAPATPARQQATIVRAVHAGDWAPEPLALEVFGRGLAGEGIEIRIEDRPLAEVGGLDPRPHLVVASGIAEHDWSEAEQAALAEYVRAGGVVLFETPGGRGGFTASAETMAQSCFSTTAVPVSQSRIITARGLPGAQPLQSVEYRPYALAVFGARETAPRLRGLAVQGQMRVLFSREDLSHALLGQPCWGVAGYSPESATALLRNVLLHALAPPGPAEPEPAPPSGHGTPDPPPP
jgi:hypothetical protein